MANTSKYIDVPERMRVMEQLRSPALKAAPATFGHCQPVFVAEVRLQLVHEPVEWCTLAQLAQFAS